MKYRILPLLLTLLLALSLAACGQNEASQQQTQSVGGLGSQSELDKPAGSQDQTEEEPQTQETAVPELDASAFRVQVSNGTWTEVKDADFDLEDYAADEDDGQLPQGWTLPDGVEEDYLRLQVKGDYLLYAQYEETVLPHGLTVARRDGEQWIPVYAFDGGLTHTWQDFFSPDGTKILFPWKTDSQSADWKLRVVDLATGAGVDVDPPEEMTRYQLFCARWYDNAHIQAGILDGSGAGESQTWLYAFPSVEE